MMKVTIRYKSREEEFFEAIDGPFPMQNSGLSPSGNFESRYFFYVVPGPVAYGRRFFNLDSVESWDHAEMFSKLEAPLEKTPGK